MKSLNKNIFAVLFVTIFIGGNLFPITVTAQSLPINISDVNVWIEIEDVWGNIPVFTIYQNTSSEIWKDFHVRIPNTQVFWDINLGGEFGHFGLSPDKKTLNLWDGSVAPNDGIILGFSLSPGGKVKYQVQATTSGSPQPVPLPGALPLFISGLLLALRQVKASKAMARSSP